MTASGGREPEIADFTAARVQRPRRWQPVVVAGWLVVLAGFVALGLSGRSTDSSAGVGAAPSIAPPVPTFPSGTMPVETSGPGPIQLLAQRDANGVFIHGDVYAADITWVFFSLQAADGRVAGWASVSVPGSAGPAASGAPALRFDVELAVPSNFNPGPLAVLAHAYDAHGALVSATSLDLRLGGGPAPTH